MADVTFRDRVLRLLHRNNWKTVPAVPIVGPALSPHRFCPYWLYGGQTGALNTTNNRVDYFPFVLQEDITVQRLGTYCTAVGAGTVEVGIYDDLNGRPNNRIYTTGAISVAATTGFKEATGVNQILAKGTRYWLAIVYTNGTIKSIQTATGVPVIQGPTESATTTSTTYPVVGLSQNATALPAVAGATGVVSSYAMYLYIADS